MYSRRITQTLLENSQSPVIGEAVKEWAYEGQCGAGDFPACELCGCQTVIYWFEIANDRNRRKLRIGSECIQNWDNPLLVYEINEAKKKLVKAEAIRKRFAEVAACSTSAKWAAENKDSLIESIKKYGKLREKPASIIKKILEKQKASDS